MISKLTVCVLIPAYNEEKQIGPLILDVQGRGYAVLGVDDGSTDSTAQVIKDSGANLIRLALNQGKGAAIRTGFDWVVKNGYEGVIIMDADGQHAPEQLDDFLRALDAGTADVVVGNRMNEPRGMPFLRRWTNRVMSWFISFVARQRIPDTQCGYRALTRETLKSISLSTRRFEIESEILMVAARRSLKIKSIPIHSVYRDETSHIRPLADTLRFLKFYFSFIFYQ